MKALVTGGAGFIGSSVAQLFLETGHEVTVLDNLSSGYRENCPSSRFVLGDVTDSSDVAAAMKDCDVICHLAASVGNLRSIENPRADAATNYLGTLTVLEAARHAGIDKVVLSSSAGIFGELKTIPIAEDHPVEPDSPYGVSKLAAEKLCLVFNKLYGMRSVCLRYFNVYGVRQRYDAYGNVIPIFAERALSGVDLTIYGDGEQTRDFVNVRDVAAANVAAALDSRVHGAFNLGSGTRVTINWLAETITTLCGTRVGIRHGPSRPGDVRDSLADISRARAAFGYSPSIELEAGLADYIAWLRQDPISLTARHRLD